MFPFFWLILSVIICLKSWGQKLGSVQVFGWFGFYDVAAHKAEDVHAPVLLCIH